MVVTSLHPVLLGFWAKPDSRPKEGGCGVDFERLALNSGRNASAANRPVLFASLPKKTES